MRVFFVLVLALVLLPVAAKSQTKPVPLPPIPHRVAKQVAVATPLAPPAAAAIRPGDLVAEVTLGEIGFINGVRLSNLGGHRELFVPLPQDGKITASELVLTIDDLSAYEAKRNLEVQANDRTIAAIALDGKSRDRTIRVPLGRLRPKDGYLKLSFLYSGAATLDRCIDVRYVGDSVTIRPETAVELDIAGTLDVVTTSMLMPHDVAIVLPGRRVTENEMATAVTVARSLISSGHRVLYYHGYDALTDLTKRGEGERWTRGIILVGPLAEVADIVDPPLAQLAGPAPSFGTLAAVRVGGVPALLVSDSNAVRAGRLFASPWRAATRGMAAAVVGDAVSADLPTERVSFEQLGVAPAQADVFGRADMTTVIDARRLPPQTRATRLLLDVMVAPDGAGQKAVVSAFVNERLLGSSVAAIGEPTHLDLALPIGLVGILANVRVVVQRDSAQGDCRFEAQGYPAQILGSSVLVLAKADDKPHDFSDLPPRFAQGIRLMLPAAAADQPTHVLGIVAQVIGQLSPDATPLRVSFAAGGNAAPAPDAPFIVFGDQPPAGANPRVHFDRGRVAVTDRSGRTLLDLGGFAGDAVAQLVSAGGYPGVWIKPLAADGSAPSPSELRLDHGDVAFIDSNGVALAMSSERDTVVRISYPDQMSWLTVAERFRAWIIAGLWLLVTCALLFVLQRLFRRRRPRTSE
jgi:hypothetical protein